jgi:hypothetical protein
MNLEVDGDSLDIVTFQIYVLSIAFSALVVILRAGKSSTPLSMMMKLLFSGQRIATSHEMPY